MKKFKKILITGSSGTIGTRLFEKLLEKGYEVVGFDKNKNIWNPELNKYTVIGNLLRKEDIGKLEKGFDLVIHLAANARVYDLVVSPDLALENIVTTYNVLEFSRKNNIGRTIFSSSRETYGNIKKSILREEDVNIQSCESPYAASKLSGEALIYSYARCYNLNYIVFRFSNVYGMYDNSNRFVPLMIRKMKKNEDIEIYGKDKFLDFTYIDDCVEGIIKGVENFDGASNNTFNLSSGRSYGLKDVASIIKNSIKSKSKISIKKNRPGEVVKFSANILKAKKILGYKPKVLIEEGVKNSINWYNKNID